MNALRMLRNTCTVSRKTETIASANGFVTETWADTTGVKCSVQTQNGREAMEHFRETGRKTYNVYFPSGTDVRVSDVLKSFSGPGGISANLSVTSPPIDHSGLSPYLMVIAEEIGGYGAA